MAREVLLTALRRHPQTSGLPSFASSTGSGAEEPKEVSWEDMFKKKAAEEEENLNYNDLGQDPYTTNRKHDISRDLSFLLVFVGTAVLVMFCLAMVGLILGAAGALFLILPSIGVVVIIRPKALQSERQVRTKPAEWALFVFGVWLCLVLLYFLLMPLGVLGGPMPSQADEIFRNLQFGISLALLISVVQSSHYILSFRESFDPSKDFEALRSNLNPFRLNPFGSREQSAPVERGVSSRGWEALRRRRVSLIRIAYRLPKKRKLENGFLVPDQTSSGSRSSFSLNGEENNAESRGSETLFAWYEEHPLAFFGPRREHEQMNRERSDQDQGENKEQRLFAFLASFIGLQEFLELKASSGKRSRLARVRQILFSVLLLLVGFLEQTAQYCFSWVSGDVPPCYLPKPPGVECNIPCFNVPSGYFNVTLTHSDCGGRKANHLVLLLSILFSSAMLGLGAWRFVEALLLFRRYHLAYLRLGQAPQVYAWPRKQVKKISQEDEEDDQQAAEDQKANEEEWVKRQAMFLEFMKPVSDIFNDEMSGRGEKKHHAFGTHNLYWYPKVPEEAGAELQEMIVRNVGVDQVVCSTQLPRINLAWWFRFHSGLTEHLRTDLWKVWPSIMAGAFITITQLLVLVWRAWKAPDAAKLPQQDAIGVLFSSVVYGGGFLTVVLWGSFVNQGILASFQDMELFMTQNLLRVRQADRQYLEWAKQHPFQIDIFGWTMDRNMGFSALGSVSTSILFALAGHAGQILNALNGGSGAGGTSGFR